MINLKRRDSRLKKSVAPVDYSQFEPGGAALAATFKYALEQSE